MNTTNPKIGLTMPEVIKRQAQYGENVLAGKKKLKPLVAFIKKFKSPLVIILIVASAISISLGEHTDAAIIIIMILISAILDFINTRKSEKAVAELVAKVAITANIRRNGHERELPIKEIVPGDIIILSAGDVVPADAAILEAKDFYVNQSALTGEAFPLEKRNADQVFMGSNVITGFATVEATATGAKTQYGAIAAQLAATAPETEFERGIKRFSYFIMQITSVLVICVFFTNTLMHRGLFESFVFALAIAIGLTPELLPVVISVALSHGSMKMAKKAVIVKNLSAIQNFGEMNILCTDKTGTLTEDRITVVKYIDGWGKTADPVLFFSYLNSIFHTGIINPLDLAIKQFKNLDVAAYKKIDEVPFDSLRRRSSVVVEKDNERMIVTKGAPENILEICTRYQKDGQNFPLDKNFTLAAQKQFLALSKDGFRVLAVAYKPGAPKQESYEKEDEATLVFLGFIAFYDPPKETAKGAVKELEELGIEIKILTGDNELLTEKICRDIGLPIRGIIVGEAVDKLNEDQLQRLAPQTTIFARLNPNQKERIILSLKKTGAAVGYLGDGVNDAPALKAADVSISVNNAVDVAKETADIILLRKSLRVLRDGVMEGRKTFQNTMKYIMIGLSSNFGNMFSMAVLPLFVPFFPMLPSQILLNNFMYDVSQFALPTDKVDTQDIQRPRRWNIKFIRKFMFAFGPVSSIFDFSTFAVMWFLFHPTVAQFQTAWFIESLTTQTLVIYIIRTRKIPFLQSSPSLWLMLSTLLVVGLGWLLPFLSIGRLMRFERLSAPMLGSIVILVVIYLILAQFMKMLFYRHLSKKYLGTPAG